MSTPTVSPATPAIMRSIADPRDRTPADTNGATSTGTGPAKRSTAKRTPAKVATKRTPAKSAAAKAVKLVPAKSATAGKYADQRVVANELIKVAGNMIKGWSPAKVKRSGITQADAREMVTRWLSYLPNGTEWSDSLGTRSDAGRRAKVVAPVPAKRTRSTAKRTPAKVTRKSA